GVWHLNQSFSDSTSHGNDGSNNGTGDFAGKIANGRDFNGSSYITVGHDGSLQMSNYLTVEAWVNPDTDYAWQTIVSKMDAQQEDLYFVLDDSSSSLYVGLSGVHTDWDSGVDIPTGSWRHVAVTYDGTDVRVYSNGTRTNYGGATGTLDLGTNTHDLYIGYNEGWTNEIWDGKLDEVRISNYARPGTWISTEFNNQDNPGPGAGAFFKSLGGEEVNTDVDLGNHAAGQEGNKFGSGSSVTGAELFAFKLTNNTASSKTVTQVQFQLSSVIGIAQGDFANLLIYADSNDDGYIDAGETTTVGGSGVVNSGVTTITFNTSFTINASTTVNYILKGDVSSLVEGDTVIIGLGTSNITLQSGTVGGTSPTNVTHTWVPWWDPAYGYCEQITITAPASKDVPNGYPIKLTFDHASLYSAGKSQEYGDDIRILYWNGSSWTEVPRTLFDNNLTSSSWNQSNTTILFKTQADIPAGTSNTSYYIYYGNPGASSPPTNTLSSRYFVAESLTETQTSSTSYASKVQLQFTPSSTSEHWVVVATWRQREVGNLGTTTTAGFGRVSLNGAPRTGTSDITFRMSGDVWKTFQAFLKITDTTSLQTVSIDFRANGGTDAIDNARILAFMIPDPTNADIQYSEDLPVFTDTANPTASLTTTFSPSSQGDYLWMANGYVHEGPGGGSNGGLFARDETDTTQQNSAESYIGVGGGFVPFLHFERRNLTTGSKTFTIRHQPDTAGGEREGLTQLLFRADVFDTVESASAPILTTTTSTTPVTKNTLTTAGAGSAHDYVYLAVMGMDHTVQNVALSTFGEVRLGGTQMLAEEVAIDRSGNNREIAWAYAEQSTGSRTIDTRFWVESGQTAEAQYAHILSLRYIEPNTSLPPNLNQIHYRWRNDDGNETGGSDTITVEDSDYNTTVGSTLTIPSFTVQGTNRLMMVGVSINNDGYESVTEVTWNGSEPFTKIRHDTYDNDSRTEIWYLKNPTATTADVAVTFSGDLVQEAIAGVVTFTGADLSDTFRNDNGNSWDILLTPSISVDTAVGDMVFGVVSAEYQSIVSTTADTEPWHEDLYSGFSAAGGTKAGVASSTTISWTLDVENHCAISAVSIKPAPLPGATFLANEETPISDLAQSTTARLRLMVSNEGGECSIQYRLQYKESTGGTWTNVPDSATTEHWQMSDSDYIDNAGEPTSDIDPGLTNPGGGTFVQGELRDNTAVTSVITLFPARFTEIEYSIEATPDATDGQTYYFRVTRSNGTTDNFTYPALLDDYPNVTLAGVLNSPPTAPTTPYCDNTTAQSGQPSPVSGITDTSPAFSAIYEDPDLGDIANKYRVEVNTQSDFGGTIMWDSGAAGTTMADTPRGNRSPDIIYAGSALQDATTYYWRITFWDDDGIEGAVSDTQQFTTTTLVNAAPSAPTTPYCDNTTAQSGQPSPATGITDPTPAFSAIYEDPDPGDIANKYRVEVNTQSDFAGTVMWDSGAAPWPTPSRETDHPTSSTPALRYRMPPPTTGASPSGMMTGQKEPSAIPSSSPSRPSITILTGSRSPSIPARWWWVVRMN
ncbi:MAG: hypothetical protein AMJ46_14490, partial [Latescibacteria bacterium DG_63]